MGILGNRESLSILSELAGKTSITLMSGLA